MSGFAIRVACADEAAALSALCKRSKAHWGYDAQFMQLSDASLTIAPQLIATGRVLVAERDGVLLGMASLDPLPGGLWDLLHMFIDPAAIGSGAGRVLFDAITALARAQGGTRMQIHADPHAEGFYLRLGATRVGEAPSDSVPGRMLPVLDYAL